jgi:hypothetical protein
MLISEITARVKRFSQLGLEAASPGAEKVFDPSASGRPVMARVNTSTLFGGAQFLGEMRRRGAGELHVAEPI